MEFTQEDIDNTLTEIIKQLHYVTVDHAPNKDHLLFEVIAEFWTEDDFSKARQIGLDVQYIGPIFLKNDPKFKDVQKWGIKVELEYIGRHRIVMG